MLCTKYHTLEPHLHHRFSELQPYLDGLFLFPLTSLSFLTFRLYSNHHLIIVMEGLPPELKLELMQRLDNFCSLSTLIHAIPSFYHVLVHAKLTVLSSILKTAIQLPVVSDALTVLESSKLSNATSEEVRTILQNYKHGLENEHTTVLIEPSSSLATCVDIVRKHRLIEWFRQDLCRSNLPTPPLTNPQEPTDPLPVSTEENTRIYRALYRFELYCNLFRDANLYRLNTYEARTRLLKLWPSWEVEELSCIHNYLSRRLSEVLDEVAEHDVETGGFYHNVGKDRALSPPTCWTDISFLQD